MKKIHEFMFNGQIRISEVGMLSEEEVETLCFKKGDILFVKEKNRHGRY